MKINMSQMSVAELIEGDKLTRESIGKSLDDCTKADLERVTQILTDYAATLAMEREMVLEEMAALSGLTLDVIREIIARSCDDEGEGAS